VCVCVCVCVCVEIHLEALLTSALESGRDVGTVTYTLTKMRGCFQSISLHHIPGYPLIKSCENDITCAHK
jgi:hypothetical protein